MVAGREAVSAQSNNSELVEGLIYEVEETPGFDGEVKIRLMIDSPLTLGAGVAHSKITFTQQSDGQAYINFYTSDRATTEALMTQMSSSLAILLTEEVVDVSLPEFAFYTFCIQAEIGIETTSFISHFLNSLYAIDGFMPEEIYKARAEFLEKMWTALFSSAEASSPAAGAGVCKLQRERLSGSDASSASQSTLTLSGEEFSGAFAELFPWSEEPQIPSSGAGAGVSGLFLREGSSAVDSASRSSLLSGWAGFSDEGFVDLFPWSE